MNDNSLACRAIVIAGIIVAIAVVFAIGCLMWKHS